MSIGGIIIAALVVSVTGLVIGLLLGLAGEKFEVEVDEKELQVRELLPGNNCGGCGFAGCDALAKAIAAGEAPVNACPVAGSEKAELISAVMGVENETKEKQVAFVKCAGTCDKTRVKYNYYGISDCKKMALIPGRGDKVCSFGCMGYGSCVKACMFDAMKIENGIAVVDKEKCVACGACVKECPNNLIEIVPYKAEHFVRCSSKDKGKEVKLACDTGCIGCMLCVKNCEANAISVVENIAHIDYNKCTNCGKCVEKCPVKAII
ncbi:RnfABCDGE type electron transport complex subunit B [Anaerosporobacter sp.]|uniref:RnfABCDGE type electron transport complex subunit B n=1 Tax=Anaerosporobacter sp. TaxID=1872529 RepID=UPI00286F68BE|nr:RnfABCDGE type electron transport complex subunit B [Anaerosporobacter sp.]